MKNNKSLEPAKVHGYLLLAILFLAISILLLMQSSLNPWGNAMTSTDSSVFIYSANRIMEGKVLYKDFFDHKGPIFYFIEVMALSLTRRKYYSEYG